MADSKAGRNAVNNAWNYFVSWLQWGSARTLKSMQANIDTLRQVTRH